MRLNLNIPLVPILTFLSSCLSGETLVPIHVARLNYSVNNSLAESIDESGGMRRVFATAAARWPPIGTAAG